MSTPQRGRASESSNFIQADDLALANAWSIATKNAEKGTDQNGGEFWTDV